MKDYSAYDDYRDLLKDLYHAKKDENPNFSYGYCARLLKTSRSYLKHLTEKKIHTKPDKLSSLMNLFALSTVEKMCFLTLYLKSITDDPELKAFCRDSLQILSANKEDNHFTDNTLHSLTNYNPFSSALSMTLDALLETKQFKDDPKWIKDTLVGDYSEQEIEEALTQLRKKEQGEQTYGRPTVGEVNFLNSYGVGLDRAAQAMKEPHAHKPCSFYMMAISLSREDSDKLFEKFRNFKDEALALAKNSSPKEQVYFLSNSLFTVSQE